MEFGSAPQRPNRRWRAPYRMQIVKLAARVRPTGRFFDCAAFFEGIEAGIRIGLQHALERENMCLRMDVPATEL